MEKNASQNMSLVFSYLELRKAIGILGMALPLVVSLGAWLFFRAGIQRSISAYYHTGMRDVFVGTLFAIGFFLLSYKGYERSDAIAGDLGCLFAVGVALFPTAPEGQVTGAARLVGTVHLVFAGLFFLTLIYSSLFLFTKTDAARTPTTRKLQRNMVYRACGYTMAACIVLIMLYFFLLEDFVPQLAGSRPVYGLEALAILAFGISWFTKGEAILKDET